MAIELTTQETPVIRKVKELCQTIVEQPHFSEMLGAIESFMGDPEARGLYQRVTELQEKLVAKQNRGESLSDDEIGEFEMERDLLLENKVANAFLDARQQMSQVQESVSKHVQLTFELGRVPLDEDLEASSGGGCCGGGGGGGCGCN
jgi:cell fate (sporulation/competence/biofilm development) regulator YlbF (YheA/YmcA/DUF963 family)